MQAILSPTSPVLRALLGATVLALCSAQEARAASTTAPSSPNALLPVVEKLYNQFEFDAALDTIKKAYAVAGNGQAELAWLGMMEGLIYVELSRNDRARIAFKRALSVDPDATLPYEGPPIAGKIFREVRKELHLQEKPPEKPPAPVVTAPTPPVESPVAVPPAVEAEQPKPQPSSEVAVQLPPQAVPAPPPPAPLVADAKEPTGPRETLPSTRPSMAPIGFRLLAEGSIGLVGSIVLAPVGGLMGLATMAAYYGITGSSSDSSTLTALFVATGVMAAVGVVAGSWLGVQLGGHFTGGEGHLLPTLVGSLAGAAGGAALVGLVNAGSSLSSATGGVVFLISLLLPLVGATVGYEWSNAPTPQPTARNGAEPLHLFADVNAVSGRTRVVVGLTQAF